MCKKQRDERDSALDAEHRALMRAAAIEADRDKIQRQFKVGIILYSRFERFELVSDMVTWHFLTHCHQLTGISYKLQ